MICGRETKDMGILQTIAQAHVSNGTSEGGRALALISCLCLFLLAPTPDNCNTANLQRKLMHRGYQLISRKHIVALVQNQAQKLLQKTLLLVLEG